MACHKLSKFQKVENTTLFGTFWHKCVQFDPTFLSYQMLSRFIIKTLKNTGVFLILSTDCSNRRNSLLGLFERQFLLFGTDRGVEEGSFQIEGELSDNSWSNFYL